jgi:hypothetical protein
VTRRGPARWGRGLTLLLAVLVAALAYANWRVVELEIDISPAAAEGQAAESFAPPGLEPPPEPPPLSAFDEIIQRPLFNAGRLPPEVLGETAEEDAEPAAADAELPTAPDLQLVGVAINGATRQALLRAPGDGADWVREGESFGGWRLEKVDAEGVVLGSGERTHELRLYPPRDGGSAGQ